MSTSSLAQPSRVTTVSAAARDAGDDARYGSITQRSRSAPIASATRNATSAESMPPESPTTARSKPACRSCARTKAVITRRAMPVSIARSGGSSNSESVGSPGGADAIRSALSSRRGRRGAVLADPGPLGRIVAELARHELRPFVAQQRKADPLAPDGGELHVGEDERLLVERCLDDHVPGGPQDHRAAPERDRLVHPDPVTEDHDARRQLGIRAQERSPRDRGPEAAGVHGRDVPARRGGDVDQDLGAIEGEDFWHL